MTNRLLRNAFKFLTMLVIEVIALGVVFLGR
jgi:hypothetical protein